MQQQQKQEVSSAIPASTVSNLSKGTGTEIIGGIVHFAPGKIVKQRWEVLETLGSGGCGSVYKVRCLDPRMGKNYIAALKAEARSPDDHGVLKIEVATLARLRNCKHVIRLIESGHRHSYNYMVISLMSKDLLSLKHMCKEGFCENTLIRIGVHALYAIKQVHEMGYVHRDVKPGNIMNGYVGRDRRMFFLIDYGMTRSFVVRTGKQVSIREPRRVILLRGTLRYCSLNVHDRKEQGRVDDLWAMLYMLVELYIGLQWHKKDEQEIISQKRTTPDKELFSECPPEFIDIAVYLRTLNYASRPDYYKIYELLMATMRREGYAFQDKYDWEDENGPDPECQTAVEEESGRRKKKNSTTSEFLLYPCADPKYFKEQILPI